FYRRERPNLRLGSGSSHHPGPRNPGRGNTPPFASPESIPAGPRQNGPLLPAGGTTRPERAKPTPGAEFRDRTEMAQPELACRLTGGLQTGVSYSLRQLGTARPHVERLVGPHYGLRQRAHYQPQRTLHPVESGDVGYRWRNTSVEQCHGRL